MLSSDNKSSLPLPSSALLRRFSTSVTNGKKSEAKNKPVASGFNSFAIFAGELGLILESEKIVSEVIDILPMCTIPNAPSWLYSMANLRGNITPVFNLLDIFGYPDENNIENKKILVIGSKEQAVGILIEKIPFKIELNYNDKVDVMANLPEKLSPFVRTCYEKNNSLWVDWDVNGFFNSLKVK